MREAVRQCVAVTHLSPLCHIPRHDLVPCVTPVSVHLLPAQSPVMARPHPPAEPGLHLRVAKLRHHRARAPVTHAQTLGGGAARALARVQAINSHL